MIRGRCAPTQRALDVPACWRARAALYLRCICAPFAGVSVVDSSGGGGESVVALQLCVFAQNLASQPSDHTYKLSSIRPPRAQTQTTYYCWRIHAGALFGSRGGGRPPPGISCAPIAPCPAADSPPYPCGIASAPIISARPIRPP